MSPFAQLAPVRDQLVRKERDWHFANTARESTMTWNHPQLGRFLVSVAGRDVGNPQSSEGYAWARIGKGASHMPSTIRVNFAASFDDDVNLVLQARGNDVQTCYGDIPSLQVDVEWDNGRPLTRKRDRDNLDHFLVTGDCRVLQLQTSVLTRNDAFWICNHELWATQIYEVREEHPAYATVEIDGKRYAAANLSENQAYPCVVNDKQPFAIADFLFTNSVTGRKVIEAMLQEGLVPPVVEKRPEIEWNPPPFPQQDGFEGAIVLWFNPNVGAKVRTKSGNEKFVPLKGIRAANGATPMWNGDFTIVTPKQQVLLRMEGKAPNAFATIRPVN